MSFLRATNKRQVKYLLPFSYVFVKFFLKRKEKKERKEINCAASAVAIPPRVGYVHFRVSHPAPHRQVVILRVKDPDGDVAHRQLFGEMEAKANVAKDETFKPKFKK